MRHDAMHRPSDPADENAMAYWRAHRMVRALRGWYLHLLIYLAVNGWLWFRFLFMPSPNWAHRSVEAGWPWPLTTTLAWGLGLAIHGLLVWWRVSQRGRDWESRKIDQFMNRD